MKKTISPRDLELLSEYLDGRLDARKRANLETRLKSNAELAETLRDLTQTRNLLRNLPKLKAPRSFKLTPEMVGQRTVHRVYPAFQFASVLASLLLVLVLAGDFLGLGAPNASPALAPLSAAQPPAEGHTIVAFSANNPQPQSATPGSALDLTPPSSGSGSQPSDTVSRAAALAASETVSPTISEKTGIQPTLVGPNAASVHPQETPPAVTFEQATTNEATSAPLSFDASVPPHTPKQPISLSALRIGEIILALIALATGLAAYLLRRRVGG